MSVASSLVLACLASLMLLGIFVVVYALIRLARSGKTGAGAVSDFIIPWFGSKKIELKGPAWLLLVAIGVLMMASPVLAVFAQKSTDVTVPPVTVQRVQENERLPQQDSASFRFRSDLSVLDLRRAQKTPWYSQFPLLANSEEKKRTKPAILRNVMLVEKVAPANELVLTYSTSGSLVVRCLSHAATYMEKLVTENGLTTDTWAVTADVSAMPMNTEFEVIVEATYYNEFTGAEGSAYSTYGNRQNESEDLSIALIFPDDKPMKSMSVMEYPPNGGQGKEFGGTKREFRDPNPDNS